MWGFAEGVCRINQEKMCDVHKLERRVVRWKKRERIEEGPLIYRTRMFSPVNNGGCVMNSIACDDARDFLRYRGKDAAARAIAGSEEESRSHRPSLRGGREKRFVIPKM